MLHVLVLNIRLSDYRAWTIDQIMSWGPVSKSKRIAFDVEFSDQKKIKEKNLKLPESQCIN